MYHFWPLSGDSFSGALEDTPTLLTLIIIFIVSDLGRGCRPRLRRPLQPAATTVARRHHCLPPLSHAAASGGRGSATRGDPIITNQGKREGCAATRDDTISSRHIKRRWHAKRQGCDKRSRKNQPGQSQGKFEVEAQ